MNTGRIIGIILIGVGLVVCLPGTALALISAETMGGRVLGATLAVILAAPPVAIGAFLLVRGRSEEAAMAVVRRQKKLLGMVSVQGRVNVAEAALDLGIDREQVKSDVIDLVNKGLFAGYINWDDGDLISVDAAKMDTTKCPNCGGQMELAGKGYVKCQYCGADIFLH